MKRILVLCGLIAILASPSRSEDLEWGTVAAGHSLSVLRVSGKVIPKEGALSIESARVQGRIVTLLKQEGEPVQKGDRLFSVNCAECLSLSKEKQTAVDRGIQELVESTRQREKQLGLSVTDNDCYILATHSGVLMKRQVELGSVFNMGDPLATILDVRNLIIELEVPEADLAHVRPGQSVHVRLASSPDRSFYPHIDRVLPTIDPVSRTGRVYLSPFALPPGATLDSLVFAEIAMGTSQNTLKVPSSGVVFSHNRRYVVKKTASKPEPVPVDVVDESENYCSVRASSGSTLKVGDEIAVRGAIYLMQDMQDPGE